MLEFTYRTFDPGAPVDERRLADALFQIMGGSVHELDDIVAALNRSGCPRVDSQPWTGENFAAELARLGKWTNCVGAPVGTHSQPGATRRIHDAR